MSPSVNSTGRLRDFGKTSLSRFGGDHLNSTPICRERAAIAESIARVNSARGSIHSDSTRKSLPGGQKVGLEFRHDRMERTPNTFNAHRLVWLAETQGLQDALIEGLFAGYFTKGRDIGDRATLTEIGVEAGLDRPRVEAFLSGEEGVSEVRRAERMAYEGGVSGVPTVIVNGQPAFSGALKDELMIGRIRAIATAAPALDGSASSGAVRTGQPRG